MSIYLWHIIKCCSFVPLNKKTGGTEVYFWCPNLKKNRSIPSEPLGRKVVIMAKTKSKQKNRNKKTSRHKSQILKIRDWLGFFFTVAGFFLSLSSTVHIDIHVQYSIVIEVYNNSLKEETHGNSDFLLKLENDTDIAKKDNTDKQKWQMEWVYINSKEHLYDTLKRKTFEDT